MALVEAAAAAVAKTVASKAASEWLSHSGQKRHSNQPLSEQLKVTFSDRFVRRNVERQIDSITDDGVSPFHGFSDCVKAFRAAMMASQ